MTRAELIALLAARQDTLSREDVDAAVRIILRRMSDALAGGERIEIRGFGSFTSVPRPARTARNPRTGEPVAIPARHVPHFKPGKELRERVNAQIAADAPRRLQRHSVPHPSQSPASPPAVGD
jgi:integration host factor subunit beta